MIRSSCLEDFRRKLGEEMRICVDVQVPFMETCWDLGDHIGSMWVIGTTFRWCARHVCA